MFGMLYYGVVLVLMPMLEQMHQKVTLNLQSSYADDLGTSGEDVANAQCTCAFCVIRDPDVGIIPT